MPLNRLTCAACCRSTGDILLDLGLKNVTLIGPISTTKKVELKNLKTITDANDQGPDIAGASLLAVSTGDLGTVGNSLETSLGAVEATATGGIFLDNQRELTIGGVSSAVSGLVAGGALKVIGNLLLNVNENVTANFQCRT